ncbi:hypothetical protein Mal64_34090 [Pseudobythopirellula maris]|uniref:Uncharacterized protein n=1 Tax=Pseudobythopirellula maris TaxID=2527991 RepID=A0A5C5ZJ83_9BACT|nr:hypothetical protein [Pseudobythopirellula maris]TWT86583.1 hypothetical protein Mal64_34090 [Pseudobythopirellula maris]
MIDSSTLPPTLLSDRPTARPTTLRRHTDTRLHTVLRGNALPLGDAFELVPLKLSSRREEVVFAIRSRPGRDGQKSSATIDCPGHYVSGRDGRFLLLERKAGKSFLVNQRYRVQVLRVLSHSVRIVVDDERGRRDQDFQCNASYGASDWRPRRGGSGIA